MCKLFTLIIRDPIHYWAYDSFLVHASRKTSVRHARLFVAATEPRGRRKTAVVEQLRQTLVNSVPDTFIWMLCNSPLYTLHTTTSK